MIAPDQTTFVYLRSFYVEPDEGAACLHPSGCRAEVSSEVSFSGSGSSQTESEAVIDRRLWSDADSIGFFALVG